MMEIDLRGDTVVRVGDQFGLGRIVADSPK